MGLVLLRIVIGGSALIHGGIAVGVGASWTGTLAIVCGASLIFGFLTPLAAGLLCVGAAYAAFFEGMWIVGSAGIVAAAIALLGPGGFSVDARLFGRREIIIPPRSPESGIKKP